MDNDDFNTDWDAAPLEMWCDKVVAEYWWWKGRRVGELAGIKAGVKQANDDLREILRAEQERLR